MDGTALSYLGGRSACYMTMHGEVPPPPPPPSLRVSDDDDQIVWRVAVRFILSFQLQRFLTSRDPDHRAPQFFTFTLIIGLGSVADRMYAVTPLIHESLEVVIAACTDRL